MKNSKDPHNFSEATGLISREFHRNGEPPTKMGIGSGAIVKYNNVPLLITAHHVLAKMDPKTGGVPNKIIITGEKICLEQNLYEDMETMGGELFVFDKSNDIAIIKIRDPKGKVWRDFNSNLFNENHSHVKLEIGQKCFVIGYPNGIFTSGHSGPLPIWKGATIASEPLLACDKNPLLIDTWGAPGMSGGPVITLSKNQYNQIDGHRVIGIYTGRALIPNQSEHESLGRVTPMEYVTPLLNAALMKYT
jgi:S1-C subfamily serine protease